MLSNNKKFILIISVVIVLIFGINYIFITSNTKHYEQEKELLNIYLINEAKTLFDIMLITRTWNSLHESVYVKNSTLEPNKYLEKNVLKTENNETLIKINPAWMTRQISEIANQNSGYFYKITSLHPKNPDNKPDSFEEEALRYFEKNKDQKYYYNLPNLQSDDKYFNFMGFLKVEKSCLKCHAEKENKLGDIRGGIRVSIPSELYKSIYKNITENKKHNEIVIIIFSLISLITIIFSVLHFMRNQQRIKKLNLSLRKKVAHRTKELSELNKSLELKIQDAVEEVKEKEKFMIVQAKNAAMGEMISMIAHQWRQPLSEIAMINNKIVAEIMFDSNGSEEIKKNIESSFNVIDHLSKTIDDFADFFEPTKSKEKFMLSEVLNTVVQMLRATMSKNNINIIELIEDIEVFTFKRELIHVVLNILNNSKDAYIENNIDEDNRVINIILTRENDFVKLSICDNAGGIKDDDLNQIFNPYFSTKLKNGSGLGLYISKVIVEKHIGGEIVAHNYKKGACFVIKLNINRET